MILEKLRFEAYKTCKPVGEGISSGRRMLADVSFYRSPKPYLSKTPG